MKGARTSLVGRVAWAAALAACSAALVAAAATSVLAAFLLQGAEDRRLREAALTLAMELSEEPPTATHVEEIVRDETEETEHTGILFAAFDHQGQRIAGDLRIRIAERGECALNASESLRLCAADSTNGLIAVAASAHSLPTSLFAISALVAALVAGAAAWLVSRPLSRTAIAPLARLRRRLAELDIDAATQTDLGPAEHVWEVDELRKTMTQLLGRVNQAIDQARRFAANAAHELRTPLTTVRAELELLIEAARRIPEIPEASENLARVERRIAELGLLIERLLILATPKSAPSEGSEMVSLRDVIEDAIASLPVESREVVSSHEEDALIRGDAVLMTTLVTNALSNALKFGQRVRVEVHVQGREAVLCFEDDGPGLSAEDRERVFEPFFRTVDADRRRIPGHGLGLALVRHIADTHGGSVSFLDTEKGARLEVRLPIA